MIELDRITLKVIIVILKQYLREVAEGEKNRSDYAIEIAGLIDELETKINAFSQS